MIEPMDLRHLTICINNDCNMKCPYCFRKDNINKSKEFTLWAHLSAFLAWSQDISINPYSLHVMFTGGEPMLNIDNIKEGVTTLSPFRRDYNLKFGISTNLHDPEGLLNLIDDGILDFEGVSISWDGVQRYDLIDDLYFWINKVNYYADIEHDYRNLLIKIAVTKETYDHGSLYEDICYLNDYDFKNIQYYFVNGTKDYEDDKLRDNFRKDLDKLLSEDWSERIVNNIKWCKGHIESDYGYNGYFHTYCDKVGHLLYVDTDGGLWPCAFYSDESKTISTKSSYKLGTIQDRKINREIFDNIKCSDWQDYEEQFCHACTNKCANSIKEMKKIEVEEMAKKYDPRHRPRPNGVWFLDLSKI